MTKKEVWEKAKEYYKTVINTKNNYKQENKKTVKHGLYKYTNSTAILTIVNFLSLIGVTALSVLVFKANIALGVFASILSGAFLSIILPSIIKPLALKSKNKKYSGFAKMELDSFFEVMDQYIKSNYKNLINSKNENEVDKEELENFIEQTKIFADNYKNAMNKFVLNKITNINQKDYEEIKKLNQNKYKYSDEVFSKKINNIIEKNNKNVAPWCELYNNCGIVYKNLYKRTNQMNNNIPMPDEKTFSVDPCFLNKQIVKDFGISANATLTCKKMSTFDMDIDDKQIATNKTSYNSLKEREKLNNAIFER